jgi:hypothetical protein
MSDHARLSMSNHRWPSCPGSVARESEYPDIPNEASIDGTGSHLLLEICVNRNCDPDEFLGRVIGKDHPDMITGWYIKEDRCERVRMMINYIARRKGELKEMYPGCDIEVLTERTVNAGMLFDRDDWWGTCDITIICFVDGKVMWLESADYKDGRMYVPAEDNSQLQGYSIGSISTLFSGVLKIAESAIAEWDFNVRMTIVQPKTATPVRYEDQKASYMLEVAKKLNEAARKTDDIDAPLIPDGREGKGYCNWCKYKPNCEVLKEANAARLVPMKEIVESGGGDLFSILERAVTELDTLTADRISELMDMKSPFDALFNQVAKEAERRVRAKEKVPGYGLVPGRITRKWRGDEEATVKMLTAKKLRKQDIWETKLKSPAAILKNSRLSFEQKERIQRDFVSETCKRTLGKVKKEEKDITEMFKDLPPPSFI